MFLLGVGVTRSVIERADCIRTGPCGGSGVCTRTVRRRGPVGSDTKSCEDDAVDRIPALEGSCNFRDFGGYQTHDGRRVRWGRLYRSGMLSRLNSRDLEVLADLRIRTVCDLRRAEERARHPNPALGPDVLRREWDEPGDASPLRGVRFERSLSRAAARGAMVEMYGRMPALLTRRLRGVFAGLLEAGGRPIILHCTAGKDRTGLGAALILSALGVPRATIVEDYLLTNVAVDLGAWLSGNGATGAGITATAEPIQALAPQAREAVLAADATYLEASFARIEAEHGSVEAYLGSELGVDAAGRARLVQSLLEEC